MTTVLDATTALLGPSLATVSPSSRKLKKSLQRQGTICGTNNYIAPEVPYRVGDSTRLNFEFRPMPNLSYFDHLFHIHSPFFCHRLIEMERLRLQATFMALVLFCTYCCVDTFPLTDFLSSMMILCILRAKLGAKSATKQKT